MSHCGETGPTGPSGKVNEKETITQHSGNICEINGILMQDFSVPEIIKELNQLLKQAGIDVEFELDNEEHEGFEIVKLRRK